MNMHVRVTDARAETQLRPCPNCGEKNRAKVGHELFRPFYMLQCLRCGMFRSGRPFPSMPEALPFPHYAA